METITIKGHVLKKIYDLRRAGKDTKEIAGILSATFGKTYSKKFVENVLKSEEYRSNRIFILKEGMELEYSPDIVLVIGEKKEVRGKIQIILSFSCGHCFYSEDIDNEVPLEKRKPRQHIIDQVESLKSNYGSTFKIEVKYAWMEWASEFEDPDDLIKYGTYKENSFIVWYHAISWFPAIIIYADATESGKGKIIPYQVRQGVSSHHLEDTIKWIVENRPLPNQPIPADVLTTKYLGKISQGYKPPDKNIMKKYMEVGK